ncbi:MAG: DUF255 domain-containing protein [Sphingobacteriales bacterium]|jgi:thioredoxin-related protein|nr:DUF255 domain-containing protein [Sphingobacteriales bacterium]
MKQVLAIALLCIFIGTACNTNDQQNTQTPNNTANNNNAITWLTIEQVQEKNKTEPRKVIVDLYTDWCGWCKRMDSETFANPAVAQYINQNYYAVKFNAESKESVNFKGTTYEYLDNGRRGTNQLAFKLVLGDTPQGAGIGYPTFAFLDENLDRINAFPGYRDVQQMTNLLRYIAENHFSDMDLGQYESQLNIQK